MDHQTISVTSQPFAGGYYSLSQERKMRIPYGFIFFPVLILIFLLSFVAGVYWFLLIALSLFSASFYFQTIRPGILRAKRLKYKSTFHFDGEVIRVDREDPNHPVRYVPINPKDYKPAHLRKRKTGYDIEMECGLIGQAQKDVLSGLAKGMDYGDLPMIFMMANLTENDAKTMFDAIQKSQQSKND